MHLKFYITCFSICAGFCSTNCNVLNNLNIVNRFLKSNGSEPPKCLKHYNYNSASVINAVLENALAPELKNTDTSLPYIPNETNVSPVSKITSNMENLSVVNTENLDEICQKVTEEVIETSRNIQSKIDYNYENLNEMLNDKSHIKDNSEIYSRYNLIDEYEDEYDDTYDGQDIGNSVQDDTVEVDRPFTMPRVLMRYDRNQIGNIEENEDEVEEDAEEMRNRDCFVQNPAELRAKAEQRRLSLRGRGKGPPPQQRDVKGKAKGQGQEKSVLQNRDHKNTHKSSQANHNRRAGSSWKKRQGMVPS